MSGARWLESPVPLPTPAESRVIGFLRSRTKEHGYPPSMREIGEGLNLATSTVHRHLAVMERKGLVHRDPLVSRSIRVVEAGSNRATADDCMVCGAHRPPGHVLVRGPDAVAIGRVCSAHTLWEVISEERLSVEIEAVE